MRETVSGVRSLDRLAELYVTLALKVSRDLETWRSFKQSSREGSIVAGRCSWLSSVFARLWLHYRLFRSLKGFAVPATTSKYPNLYE